MAYQIQFPPVVEFKWKGEEGKWVEEIVTGRLWMCKGKGRATGKPDPVQHFTNKRISVHTRNPWRAS